MFFNCIAVGHQKISQRHLFETVAKNNNEAEIERA